MCYHPFVPTVDLARVFTHETFQPTWIVKDLLPRGTIVVLAGEAGVGKSLLSYDLALSVVCGHTFLGHETERTPVLYFDCENSWPDFRQYIQWVWIAHGSPEPSELKGILNLEHFSLETHWRETMAQRVEDVKPGLVIIDTASPAFHVADENDNSEATRNIAVLKAIQASAGNETTILVLKHARVVDDDTGGPSHHHMTVRGAKAWLSAADAVWFHTPGRRGRPRKDGLKATLLTPNKSRAFGLKETIKIRPEWTDTVPKGLRLKGEVVNVTPEGGEGEE